MGIINLKLQNQELLLKQLHKFYNNDDIPWVQLIWSAYYTDKVPHSTEPCGSFWWRDVLQLSDVYRGVTRVNVGDGKTTLFWKDLWQDQVISESHPRAFSFCRQEDISVNKLLSAESLGQIFHLPLSIEAREEIRDLQDTTRGVDPSSGTNDTWLCAWGGAKSLEPTSSIAIASEMCRWMKPLVGFGRPNAQCNGRYFSGCSWLTA